MDFAFALGCVFLSSSFFSSSLLARGVAMYDLYLEPKCCEMIDLTGLSHPWALGLK